ncbi:MAG: outer membrane beta-barrel protein [Hyphomicrobium sp.]
MLASLALATRAAALDLSDVGLGREDTVAFRDGLRKWDNAKRFGAERVVDRDRTMYQPDGVRAGNYVVYPTLGATVLFDDNIYATNKNRASDVRFEIVPVVRAKSDLPRHILDFAVGAKLTEYLRHDELNTADFRFNMDGALHFDNAHTLSFSLLSALDHEDRAAPEAPKNAAEKTGVFHNRAIIGLKRDAGRLWASFSTSIERWDFQDVKARDGSTIDQSMRDTQVAAAQARLGYRFSPGFEIQGKLRALRQDNFGATAVDFSAYGYEAIAGVSAEISPLLRWRLLGGYGIRDYDSSSMRTAGNALLEAEIQWLPTQLLTFTTIARRAYAEGVLGDGAGGRMDNSISAKVDYEVFRNLVFTLGGEYRESEFFSESRRDRVTIGRIGADYHYTKNWLFSLGFEHQTQRSNMEEDNVTRNRVWLGTKLRF